ncbi:MAG: radical SAM protein [Candidatus Parvarchaeota archaeon]
MLLKSTESLCPVCLQKVPAEIVGESDDNVYLVKTCRLHGSFKTLVWRGIKSWILWESLNDWEPERLEGDESITGVEEGCPLDCGLCPQHLRKACFIIIEVTNRCNLTCPVCFASANERYTYDIALSDIKDMLKTVLQYECKTSVPPIQISGGEPTIREDLPDIVAMAKEMGFNTIMINTNGIKIARDKEYLRRLKESGANLIYLQFDGVTDDVYLRLRGAALTNIKIKAIENCAELGLGVILVPTITKHANFHQIGDIIRFAKKRIPTVRGVHFQPISYSGRYPYMPENDSRITVPDMLRAIEEQTGGEVKANNFVPINLGRGCESHCSFTNVSILAEDGRLLPLTDFPSEGELQELIESRKSEQLWPKHARGVIKDYWKPSENCACSCKFYTGDFGELVECLQEYYLSISGMPFQDVWNIDVNRSRKCCVHIVAPGNKIIPFCTFNITSVDGKTLYRDRVYMSYINLRSR